MAFPMLMLGSLQAYQRSIYSLLIPPGQESSMFAFYEVSDKGSNLVGALVTFIVHNATGSYRLMFWYLFLEFIVAGALLVCVDVEQGMADVGKTEGIEYDDGYE